MKKKIILTLTVIFTVITAAACTYYLKNKKENMLQQEIASKIIRFHVRANSDDERDQALKIKVKDAVVKYLETRLDDAQNLDEARKILYYDSNFIKDTALKVVRSEGYDYDVKVYFENTYFPMKTYADMTFPPGEYEAFRVDIGDAEGKNWWCVLFPPLCFVDSTYSIVPDDTKELFRDIFSEDAYEEITLNSLKENDYEIRFKYLKFMNVFFQ